MPSDSPTTLQPQGLGHVVGNMTQELLEGLHGRPPGGLYQMVMGIVESALIHAVLDHVEGNKSAAAEALSISRTTLQKKLKDFSVR